MKLGEIQRKRILKKRILKNLFLVPRIGEYEMEIIRDYLKPKKKLEEVSLGRITVQSFD